MDARKEMYQQMLLFEREVLGKPMSSIDRFRWAYAMGREVALDEVQMPQV